MVFNDDAIMMRPLIAVLIVVVIACSGKKQTTAASWSDDVEADGDDLYRQVEIESDTRCKY